MLQPEQINVRKINKSWGHEIWMVNNDKYCGKILHFKKDKQFSMHYHLQKNESWYVLKGQIMFKWINTEDGLLQHEILNEGDARRIPQGLPHQLLAIVDTDIIETSTEHFDEDSYRVYRGNCSCKTTLL